MKTAERLFRLFIPGIVGILLLVGAARVEAACEVVDVDEGPPLVVTFEVQENTSGVIGLREIRVIEAENATVDIPPFPVGVISPVTVTATRINANQNFRVVLESVNTVFTISRCSYVRDVTPPNDAPICVVSSVEAGPPLQVQFTVQDGDDGLQAIEIFEALNADVDVPSFSVGTTAPIVVTATRIDPGSNMSVTLRVRDTEGQISQCNYGAPAAEDDTPPLCGVVSTDPGPPAEALLEIQDLESGLASIVVSDALNATVDIAPFSTGTNDPVEVRITQINANQSYYAVLASSDQFGNTTSCRYPLIDTSQTRPEYDAVGDDSGNFFQDQMTGLINNFSRDAQNNRINLDSDFSPQEAFSTDAGGLVPDPCYANGSGAPLAALTSAFQNANYIWEVVLQMQPAADIFLAVNACVFDRSQDDILTDGRQTGLYRTPWDPDQQVFLKGANPSVTVKALPGPNAVQGFPTAGFLLDARKLPGLETVPLSESPLALQAFLTQGVLLAYPTQGASNSAGETMYELRPGDRIQVTFGIPANNTADVWLGPESILIRYLGVVGTEIRASN